MLLWCQSIVQSSDVIIIMPGKILKILGSFLFQWLFEMAIQIVINALALTT